MRISDVLNHKGTEVMTVAPETTVRDLVALLTERRIGAVVVSTDGKTVEGIVSERDVVRALAARGAVILSEQVEAIMTPDVHTAPPGAHLDEISELMTNQRIRHVPVLVDGQLHGIVSIGDVVKSRIGELEVERDSLVTYVKSGTS